MGEAPFAHVLQREHGNMPELLKEQPEMQGVLEFDVGAAAAMARPHGDVSMQTVSVEAVQLTAVTTAAPSEEHTVQGLQGEKPNSPKLLPALQGTGKFS
jgi:hypothetical protein